MKLIKLIILSTICCGALGVGIGILYVLLLITNVYSDALLVAVSCLFTAGFLLSIASVLGILITRTCWLGLIPTVLVLLVSGLVVYGNAVINAGIRIRQEKMKEVSPLYKMKILHEALVQYAENHSGYLPDANMWCDQLLASNPDLTRAHFQHPKPEMVEVKGQCHFAFNKNLSKMRLSEVSSDTVLIFEADGDWNLAGTKELLETRYWKHGYVTMVYVDGHKGDYWYYQKAVRAFSKDGKNMYYIKPRWEP